MPPNTPLNFKNKELVTCLEMTESSSENDGYQHRLFKEVGGKRPQLVDAMKQVVGEAHQDAIDALSELEGMTLEPKTTEESKSDVNELLEESLISQQYPHKLHMNNLKGFFGEIFGGVIAVNFSLFDEDNWEIPGYLYSLFDHTFEELERAFQNDASVRNVPGQGGDDFLLFVLDDNDAIMKCIVGEAKCLETNNTKIVADAHENLGKSPAVPVSLIRLIKILKDRNNRNEDVGTERWIKALQEFYRKRKVVNDELNYESYRLFSYIVTPPKQKSKNGRWLLPSTPHEKYNGNYPLEAFEFHTNDAETIISEIYQKDE